MLKRDQDVFVGRAAQSGQTEYHPAKIVSAPEEPGGGFVIELQPPVDPAQAGALAAGSSVGIYFDYRNKFMRQDARIDAIIADRGKFTFGFTPMGEPTLAEGRACYRAATVTGDIAATINGHEACQVLDVSSTGCSVRSKLPYKAGETISVSIEYLGTTYRGAATVQSIKQLGPKDFRYGLLCLRSARSASSLQNGLQVISTAVQRNQLKRLSGAA